MQLDQFEKVTFTSHGTSIVGNLYIPEFNSPLPAIVLLGPMTFQKEQVPTEYARRLAKLGFITLVFDPRYRGESGGEPRCWENPQAKVEDVISAIDFLLTQPQVDSNRIFALAICQGVSEMLPAAADHPRIRSLATVAGHYRDREGDIAWLTEDGYKAHLENGERAAQKYQDTGEVEYVPAVDKQRSDVGMPGELVWSWYHLWADRDEWENRYAVMSDADLLKYESIGAAHRMSKPWLMVHSDGCMLPSAAKRHFDAAPSTEKQMYWKGNIAHFRFYDDPAIVDPTVLEIAAFFREHSEEAVSENLPDTVAQSVS